MKCLSEKKVSGNSTERGYTYKDTSFPENFMKERNKGNRCRKRFQSQIVNKHLRFFFISHKTFFFQKQIEKCALKGTHDSQITKLTRRRWKYLKNTLSLILKLFYE